MIINVVTMHELSPTSSSFHPSSNWIYDMITRYTYNNLAKVFYVISVFGQKVQFSYL